MRALLRVISGEKEEENQADNPCGNHTGSFWALSDIA
jgi:hypothetical protein